MTWKALLTGDQADLESLSMIFSDGDPKVAVEADGNYFLESAAFDPRMQQRTWLRPNGF